MFNKYYQNELHKLRELAKEFSLAHPAAAPMLSSESVDPDVERLLEGPMGTLVAGFDNGFVGVWDMHNGQRLLRMKLHGPIAYMAMRGRRLVAVSELGQTLNEDFGVFHEDDCTVLRSIWAQVPVAWDNGRLRVSEPPREHRCLSNP